MRKFIPVLYGLGGFLLVLGILAVVYAPGAVQKTPLDVNSTTRLSGEGAKLNAATGAFVTRPVKAVSVTKTDSKRSSGSTALFTNSTCAVFVVGDTPDCLEADDPRTLSLDSDVFATSRSTALAVSSPKLPADAVPHEGVINKWPFAAAKKTYPYWDGTVKKAVPAKYERTQKFDGLETYVYRVQVDAAPIYIVEPVDGNAGVKGTYTDDKRLYIDPRTGAIINQTETQQRSLADGTKALDLKLDFTSEQVATNVKDAKANIAKLNLLTRIVPVVGIVGGLIALGAAVALTRSRRKHDREDQGGRAGAAGAGRGGVDLSKT